MTEVRSALLTMGEFLSRDTFMKIAMVIVAVRGRMGRMV
jgi:hypothetical protein